MLHYVEKPQSYISPIINCGVYLFSLSIFELLASVFNQKQRDFYNNVSLDNIEAKEAMWLEKDILMPLAGNYFCLNRFTFRLLEPLKKILRLLKTLEEIQNVTAIE